MEYYEYDALGSFVPKFDDGLSVRIENYESEDKFYWQKGRLVDKAGKTVDLDSLRAEKSKRPRK